MAKGNKFETPLDKSDPSNTPPAENPAGDAKTVTAASIVAKDNDKFPEGSGNGAPPIPPETPGANNPPPAGDAPAPEIKRGRGRPPGAKNKNARSPEFSDAPKAAQSAQPVNYRAVATMVFKLGTNTLANIFGPEWLPRPPPAPGLPGEEEMVIEATAKYMESQQMPDIPPGVMLVLVVGMYAAPRFRAPSTKEKISGFWLWMKSKFGKKKKTHIPSTEARQQTSEKNGDAPVDPAIPPPAPMAVNADVEVM